MVGKALQIDALRALRYEGGLAATRSTAEHEPALVCRRVFEHRQTAMAQSFEATWDRWHGNRALLQPTRGRLRAQTAAPAVQPHLFVGCGKANPTLHAFCLDDAADQRFALGDCLRLAFMTIGHPDLVALFVGQ